MKGSVLLFFMLWVFWVLLSGFHWQEIAAGAVVSAVLAVVIGYGFLRGPKTGYMTGFFVLLAYVPYYAYQVALSHIDVVSRIITGRIRPSIVEVSHSHTHDWGLAMLSNSITMTPGTLTLEAMPKKLYVHWLNPGGNKQDIARKFDRFLTRIWK